MSDRWAIRFPTASAQAALPLRFAGSIEALPGESEIWLKGNGGGDELDALIRKIPDAVRYAIGTGDVLTRVGKRIPEGTLPAGRWVRFDSIINLKSQVAALPAAVTDRMPISIVRSDIEQHPGAMLVAMNVFAEYVATAPKIRLDALRFAVRADGNTLVIGRPLPPIPGQYFVDAEGVLVPVGYQWQPRLEPALIRQVLQLASGDVAMFDVDGSYELLPAECLIPVSRANVRQTVPGGTI